MDLWIRSQNKEVFAKVKELYVVNGVKCDDLEDGYDIENADFRFGRYKTKERALEVLDEIEKIIQPKMNFIVSQHIDFDNDDEGLIGCNILKEEPKIEKISDAIIYQMPKE